ncbi:MAG: thioredoxin-disulfide reductase [Terriglobia bacterium]
MSEVYDIVIVGGGPGGLTAGIYAQRARLKTVLLEKMGLGGQVAITDEVENYPGFKEISGPDLMAKFEEHAKKFGLPVELAEVESIKNNGRTKIVRTSEGDYETRAVIVAAGAHPRKLGVPGEREFTGKGVSYCATCDGFFFKEKKLVAVGGGDTAVKEALYLSKIANRVSVVHRRDELRAEKIWQERGFANSKLDWVWDSVVAEIKGNEKVGSVVVKNVKTDEETEITADGIFIFVGIVPNTDFLEVRKDPGGFVLTGENLETSVPGVFAAGDCRAQLLSRFPRQWVRAR